MSLLKKIRSIVVGDRAMLSDKIVVEYHNRDDMDYLGAIQLTKKIADISDEDYELIDTDRDNGLYSGYLTTWKFCHNGESYEDRILIVRSEQKALTDEKSRNKKIKELKHLYFLQYISCKIFDYNIKNALYLKKYILLLYITWYNILVWKIKIKLVILSKIQVITINFWFIKCVLNIEYKIIHFNY